LDIDEETFLSVFEGVPQFCVDKNIFEKGIKILDLTVDSAPIFSSKGEIRKLIQGGGISINKEKLTDADIVIDSSFLLKEKYILIQKGKKNYFLIIAK